MKRKLPTPPLDETLLEYLDQAYPERCPDPDLNDREIWMRAGERRLVRRLWKEYERQQEQPSFLE